MIAARARFGTFGYDTTTIDQISADAGRTKGTVYHHFEDKADLFQRVFAQEQQHIAARVARSPDLVSGVTTYLRAIAADPLAARITLVDAPAVLGWQVWRTCDGGPFRAMLRGALGTQPGLDDRFDLDALTELILGAVTEAAQQIATAAQPKAVARTYMTQVGRLLETVLDPTAPTRELSS